MATRHTDGKAQEDKDMGSGRSEKGDKTEKEGKKYVSQKILHSKAMRRVTGRKHGADVTTVKKVQPPPAYVQAPTARKTSDTVQHPQHSIQGLYSDLSQQQQQQQQPLQSDHLPQSLHEGSQLSDGAGASSLINQEEKQQIEADLREKLNGKDHEIEQLKKVVNQKEMLIGQLEETIRRLESDASKTHGVVSAATVLTGTAEQLRSKCDEKDAEVRRLTEESTELSACITSMNETLQSRTRRLEMKDDKYKEETAKLDIYKQNKEYEEKLGEIVKQYGELSIQHSELSAQHSQLSADFESLKRRHLEVEKLQTDTAHVLNTKSCQLEELQNELAVAKAQASMYKEDFEQERKDREAMNDQMEELKEKSSVIINRLEIANKTLVKKYKPQALEQLQEDFQISQSQIIAYKKQLDACKKDLEEERRQGQVMQDRIDDLQELTTEQRDERKLDELKLSKIAKQLEHEKTLATILQRQLQQKVDCHEGKGNHAECVTKMYDLSQQVATLQQVVSGSYTTTIDSVEGLNKEKERGRGSFGAVYEVRVDGVPCIAKRLHDILVGRRGMEPVGDEQRTAAISHFRRECDILSCLRHPNVVQFMGVHCGSDEADISLIMEYMHMDLGDCMKTYPDIPLPYKTSILRDVAYGLAYLHSCNPKPIIHRDINPGNILVTESLKAKIADLGMSKLFDKKVVMERTKTICPGAIDFMPPESLTRAPKYSDKLDIFSFSHLTVYLVNQEAPYVADNSLAPGDVEKKQIQFGKRREALDQMSHQLGGSHHPLYSTVVQCLSDTPDQRPTSRDLVKRMEEICQQHPIPHKNTLETLTVVATLRSSNKEQEETLKEMEQHNTQLKSSNQMLQSQLVATQSESSELQQRCGTLQQEVELVRGQYRELEEKNVSSSEALRTCYTDIHASLRQMETQLGLMKTTTHE